MSLEMTPNKQRLLDLANAGYEISDISIHRNDDGTGTMRHTLSKDGCPNEIVELTVARVINDDVIQAPNN